MNDTSFLIGLGIGTFFGTSFTIFITYLEKKNESEWKKRQESRIKDYIKRT